MHYIIDGYNLLFYRIGGAISAFRHEREKLITALNEQLKSISLDVTIVFDSHYFPGEGSRSHFHHIEIIFTAEKFSADEWIIHHLSQFKENKFEVVITNDRELASRAKNLNAKTQSIDQFIHWLNCRQKNHKKLKKVNPSKELPKANVPQKPFLRPKLITEEPQKECIKNFQKPSNLTPGSLEYYLAEFEQKEKMLLIEKEKKLELKSQIKAKPRKAKKSSPPLKQDIKYPTDFERWLDVFQKNDVKGT